MDLYRPVRARRWRLASVGLVGVATAYLGVPSTPAPDGEMADAGTFGPAVARGDYAEGLDGDGDGLPDEFERFCGSSDNNLDSDGDGYPDGAEWVLWSDPTDPASQPDPRPAVRSHAYEVAGVLRIFTAFYPANIDLIESFHLLAASPEFDTATEGDPGSGLGVIDLTSLLPTIADGFCGSQFLGLDLVGFHSDFDLSVLRTATPLCLAFATKLAGVSAIDQIYIGVEGATAFMIAAGPSTPTGAALFVAQPLQPIPPPHEETPEYCAVDFSDGTPVGVATLEFVVTDADCEPDGLLYCIDTDCTALANQTFLMLDYGYLQAKSDQ